MSQASQPCTWRLGLGFEYLKPHTLDVQQLARLRLDVLDYLAVVRVRVRVGMRVGDRVGVRVRVRVRVNSKS
jgi:hypothetical protein